MLSFKDPNKLPKVPWLCVAFTGKKCNAHATTKEERDHEFVSPLYSLILKEVASTTKKRKYWGKFLFSFPSTLDCALTRRIPPVPPDESSARNPTFTGFIGTNRREHSTKFENVRIFLLKFSGGRIWEEGVRHQA